MAEEDDKATPVPKKKGHATLVFETQKATEERERLRREEEAEKDKSMEARLDAANATALEQANRRADALQSALDSKDKNMEKAFALRAGEHAEAMAGKDKTIRLLAILLVLTVGAIVVFGGYKVTGGITGIGEVNMGGAAEEAPK